MVCKQYREDLDASAGGRLEPESSIQLEVHLYACPACRAELETKKSLYATLDKGLRRLNENLPAGFAARVRARVNAAEEASPGRKWLTWTAVGAAATLVIALVSTRGLWREGQGRESGPVAPQAMRSVIERPRIGTRGPISPALRGAERLTHLKRRPRSGTHPFKPAGEKEAVALVPPEQERVFTQLLEGLRSGEVKGDVLLSSVAVQANQELIIAPIVVEPIEIRPLEAVEHQPKNNSQ